MKKCEQTFPLSERASAGWGVKIQHLDFRGKKFGFRSGCGANLRSLYLGAF